MYFVVLPTPVALCTPHVSTASPTALAHASPALRRPPMLRLLYSAMLHPPFLNEQSLWQTNMLLNRRVCMVLGGMVLGGSSSMQWGGGRHSNGFKAVPSCWHARWQCLVFHRLRAHALSVPHFLEGFLCAETPIVPLGGSILQGSQSFVRVRTSWCVRSSLQVGAPAGGGTRIVCAAARARPPSHPPPARPPPARPSTDAVHVTLLSVSSRKPCAPLPFTPCSMVSIPRAALLAVLVCTLAASAR